MSLALAIWRKVRIRLKAWISRYHAISQVREGFGKAHLGRQTSLHRSSGRNKNKSAHIWNRFAWANPFLSRSIDFRIFDYENSRCSRLLIQRLKGSVLKHCECKAVIWTIFFNVFHHAKVEFYRRENCKCTRHAVTFINQILRLWI